MSVPTSACTAPYGDLILLLSIQNKQDYARLHSSELHVMARQTTASMLPRAWQKIAFLQKARPCTGFSHPVRQSVLSHTATYCVPCLGRWRAAQLECLEGEGKCLVLGVERPVAAFEFSFSHLLIHASDVTGVSEPA